MTATRLSSLFIVAALLGSATQLSAAITYDANVTPDIIFGTGNTNGGFAVEQNATEGVELGLRAKIRFNEQNDAEDTFNSDGAGNYTFVAGLPPSGFSFAPGSTSTAIWSFDWSINSNYNGSGGVLDAYDYVLSIDFNEAEGAEQFLEFDPINQSWADHSTGTNATGNGAGTRAAGTAQSPDTASYANLISTNNVAQNSWNMEFFDDATFTFDGRDEGEYIIRLEAFEKGTTTNPVASTEIAVQSVPEPTTAGLLLLGLGALAYRRRQA